MKNITLENFKKALQNTYYIKDILRNLNIPYKWCNIIRIKNFAIEKGFDLNRIFAENKKDVSLIDKKILLNKAKECNNYVELCRVLNIPHNKTNYTKLSKIIKPKDFKYGYIVLRQFFGWGKEELFKIKEAIKISTSVNDVLRNLNKSYIGGKNHTLLKDFIKKYNLDVSYFKKNRVMKTGNLSFHKPHLPLNSYLVKNSPHIISNTMLKVRLLKEGILRKACYCCGVKNWQGKELSLELHHKDGDSKNNCKENLILLCPNCHSLTKNYKSKNRESYKNKARVAQL